MIMRKKTTMSAIIGISHHIVFCQRNGKSRPTTPKRMEIVRRIPDNFSEMFMILIIAHPLNHCKILLTSPATDSVMAS